MLTSSRTQLLASGGMIIMLSVIAVFVATWFGPATEDADGVFHLVDRGCRYRRLFWQ